LKTATKFTVIPGLIDTWSASTQTLKPTKKYKTLALGICQKWKNMWGKMGKGRPSRCRQQKNYGSYQSVIEAAYTEFNVLLQRDTFLMTRLSTLGKIRLLSENRSSQDMSTYQT